MITKINKPKSHFYLFADGRKVPNMKEGCVALDLGRQAFRNRVKRGIIQKIIINNSKLSSYGQFKRAQ